MITKSKIRGARLGLPVWSLFCFSVCSVYVFGHLAHAQSPLGGAPDNDTPNTSATPKSPNLVVDDFERGVVAWSLSDSTRRGTPLLVGAVATSASNPFLPDSKSAGLFTFKAGTRASAVASRRVDGEKWAQLNAKLLTFYLSADGETRPGQTRGVDIVLRAHGANGDEAFRPPTDPETRRPLPIKLDRPGWRRVVIPLSDFRSSRGPLTNDALRRVYALQFAQNGTWDSRFFSLDQIAVEGSSAPAAPPSPSTPSVPSAPKPDANAVAVSADFKRVEGRIAASANPSLGRAQNQSGAPDSDVLENAAYRNALSALAPRFVRLDAGELCELTNSSAPDFDFSRLQSAAAQVKAIGALPFVAVTNPPAWALDARGYAIFARGCAAALNDNRTPARYFELAPDSVTFYNAGRAALKAVSATYRVGGQGDALQEGASLRALLGGASGLEFLSVTDYGLLPDAEVPTSIAETANASRLRATAQVLRASRYRDAALYVTRANLRPAGDNDAALKELSAGAWWAMYLGNASRVANQVFHEDAANPDAGLLNSEGRAYPAFYAMYFWNTFFPAASARVRVTSARADVFATAVNTPTAHNLLLVNTSNRAQIAQVSIRGFPTLRAARMRLLDSATAQPRYVPLPKSPYQRIELPPYAVAVVQFIEGKKK